MLLKPGTLRVISLNCRSMRNKMQSIMSFLDENSIDIAFIQESWLRKSDGHIINEIKEYNYKVISFRKPRKLDFGGGVAVIFKQYLKLKQIKTESFRSFENITCQVITDKGPIIFSNLYRPGYSSKHRYTAKKFCVEFNQFIELLNSYSTVTYLVGDYNFHLETLYRTDDRQETSYEIQKKNEAKMFTSVLSEFNYSQLINEPTHELGGTLDTLICNDSSYVNGWSVLGKNDVCISDHLPIFFELNTKPQVV